MGTPVCGKRSHPMSRGRWPRRRAPQSPWPHLGVSLFAPTHVMLFPARISVRSVLPASNALSSSGHILLGMSQNVSCGSGPRNLHFPLAATPTFSLRVFALGCKIFELIFLNPVYLIQCQAYGGRGVTQSLLAELKGAFVLC